MLMLDRRRWCSHLPTACARLEAATTIISWAPSGLQWANWPLMSTPVVVWVMSWCPPPLWKASPMLQLMIENRNPYLIGCMIRLTDQIDRSLVLQSALMKEDSSLVREHTWLILSSWAKLLSRD